MTEGIYASGLKESGIYQNVIESRSTNSAYGMGTDSLFDVEIENNDITVNAGGMAYGITATMAGKNLTIATNNIDATGTGAKVMSCNFSDNYAGGNGGAIWFGSTGGEISDCMFEDNSAKVNGGAIYSSTGSSATVKDSTFAQNTAKNGGAVYYAGNNNGLTIYNDTFTGNINCI